MLTGLTVRDPKVGDSVGGTYRPDHVRAWSGQRKIRRRGTYRYGCAHPENEGLPL